MQVNHGGIKQEQGDKPDPKRSAMASSEEVLMALEACNLLAGIVTVLFMGCKTENIQPRPPKVACGPTYRIEP